MMSATKEAVAAAESLCHKLMMASAGWLCALADASPGCHQMPFIRATESINRGSL